MPTYRDPTRGGFILAGVLITAVCLFGLVYAATLLSSDDITKSRRTIEDIRAKYLAVSGVEQSIDFLMQAVSKTNVSDPLLGVRNLFANGAVVQPFIGESVIDGPTPVGEFTASMTGVTAADSVTVTINSTGYLPAAPTNLPPGRQVQSWQSFSVMVRLSVDTSKSLEYAYFINNWGWFYGNTIICNGSAGSNGQFDAANYKPWVNGQSTYEGVSWDGVTAMLDGYIDDNGDGLLDGNDGGVFSGWDIVNADNLRGVGGNDINKHDFQDQIDMPNLTDLTQYETRAIAEGGKITCDAVTMSNGVYGDEGGEKQNLYLVGTAAKPIVLDGKVVVRGDVIISGNVTGQGAIYAGGNVYVPDSITYVNPPTSPRPADNSQATTEAWLSNNMNKDFLGLFAREHIVVGDHTDGTWRSHVSSWMGHAMNGSEEDAGEDRIPNTINGKDGIANTADDDILEGDNNFTMDHYTQTDSDMGLIPPGLSIGDPIPGTGEDIDGDGVYDDSTTLADIDLSCALNLGLWGGNIEAAMVYSDIASLEANRLDAVFYTNHSFCYYVKGANSAMINGSLNCRNENIIYGTPDIQFNYDVRLLCGGVGQIKDLLPRTIQPIQVMRWEVLDNDPNKYVIAVP